MNGKQLESCFLKSFKGTPLEPSLLRLYDVTYGATGVSFPADFISYRYPFQYYWELKAIQGNRFDFSKIRENQYEGLLTKSSVKGTVCGLLVYMYDHDLLYFVPIEIVKYVEDKLSRKSLNLELLDKYCLLVSHSRKRVNISIDVMKLHHESQQLVYRIYKYGIGEEGVKNGEEIEC